MENLKRLLEVLEAIEGSPTPLTPLPATFIHEDNTIKIPGKVMEYLKEQGENLELDNNGRMEMGIYNALLNKHCLGVNQIRAITFKEAPEAKNVKLDY